MKEEFDRGIKITEVRNYPKSFLPSHFDLFLESSFKLIKENFSRREVDFCLKSYLRPGLYGRIFGGIFGDDRGIPFTLVSEIHGKKFYGVCENYFGLRDQKLVFFLENYFEENVLLKGNPYNFLWEFQANPWGSVVYFPNLFREKLIFTGKGNLKVDPQKNLDKLVSYYEKDFHPFL